MCVSPWRGQVTPPTHTRTTYEHIADAPLGPEAGIDTVHDVMLYAARTHGSKNALGAREIERTITETKEVTKIVNGEETKVNKDWTYYKLTPLEWISYEQALQDARDIGSGLRELGVGGEGETFFNIYSQTS